MVFVVDVCVVCVLVVMICVYVKDERSPLHAASAPVVVVCTVY
jgi:hypothetical protein